MVLSSLFPIAAVSATVGVGGAGWWWNKRRDKGPTLQERFGAWMMANDEFNGELKTWLTERSEDEMKSLLNQLSLYCVEVGMELEWLFGEEAFNQEVRSALGEIVIAYLMSQMIAGQIAEDAQAFKLYQAFDRKPKKQLEFGNLLYARLVDDGIVSVSTANLLTGSKKKRQEHIISTIRQTGADKPKAFHQTLKAVVRDMQPGTQKSKQIESTAQSATESSEEIG